MDHATLIIINALDFVRFPFRNKQIPGQKKIQTAAYLNANNLPKYFKGEVIDQYLSKDNVRRFKIEAVDAV